MQRRQFLAACAGAGLSALVPAWAQSTDPYFAGFRKGLAEHPWLGAFAGVEGELAAGPVSFSGRLPADLRGVLYRNGPALFERAGVRYHHWFDGDGMVQAYRFTDEGLVHRGRFVETRKFRAESEKGAFIYPGFGTTARVRVPISSPDAVSTANTSVIAHGGRLLALWEGGSAHELDPDTLSTHGTVAWRDDLKGMPFSAHPKVEADGTMWNFGAFNNHLALYRIDRDGSLGKAAVIKVPGMVMNHDFVVSARHLIFVLPEMRLQMDRLREGTSFMDALEMPADRPMRVLTIEKDDFSRVRWYELPPGFVFHYGNAWDEASGQIRFDFVRSDAGGGMMTQTMRAMMRGEVAAMQAGTSRPVQVVLDPARGTLRTTETSDEVEFPRVDPRHVARRNRLLFHTATIDNRNAFTLNAVLRTDLETGRQDSFRFADGYSLEEHIPVPRPGARTEGEGWLVGCAFNARTGRTEVNVFDALRLADGPLATARLPYAIPLGFHGHFHPA